MNKCEARRLTDEGGYKIADLKAMIAAARGRGGDSRVNGIIPLEKALDLYAAAIEARPDDEEIKSWRPDPYSRRGKMVRTRDSLLIYNILRDCLA